MAQSDYYIYIIAEQGDEFCKLGVSNNPGSRLSSLQTGNPRSLDIYVTYPCAKRSLAFDIERETHYALAQFRTVGEWFSVGPEDAQKVLGPIWRKVLDKDEERARRSKEWLLAAARSR